MSEVAEIQGEVVVPAKTRKRGNGALVKAEAAPMPVQAAPGGPSLLAILQAAMTDPSASIERMHSAFDFYQRIEAAQARKAFDTAIAAAKADFDKVTKRHTVSRGKDGGGFKHEDLSDIAAAVDPALAANGLSYRFRATSNPNEPVKVTCVVTHRDGHFEETTLSAGADASGGKNGIQAIGSTLSYLQRYSLRLALGVAAGREDDGKGADQTPIERVTEQQAQEMEALAKKANIEPQIIFEHFKVESFSDLTPAQRQTALDRINTRLKLGGGQ
jgi:hypothetical protein